MNVVYLLTAVYFLFLFLIAYIGEKLFKKNKKILANPYVYSLTLGVYCTTWTYYGSVGRAATSGIDFITIYIGPTLVVFTWWIFLRHIIRISEEYNITSIADFLSFRYGKSKYLGIAVSLFCIFGIIPYIALQLKAINETFFIVSGKSFSSNNSGILNDFSFYFSLVIGIIGAFFGTRHVTEARKHPGLISIIAFESVFKLVIFLIAGGYITFYLFDGFGDIFKQMAMSKNVLIVNKFDSLITVKESLSSYFQWFTMIIMSMFAVMFLPRQFHVAVIENLDSEHIDKGMYLFPLYLLLINIFVIPIAFAGILIFNNTGDPDYYILNLFINNDNQFLSLLVYLGGLAAGSGMVIVSSVSIANMVVNNIVIPIFVKRLVKINLSFVLIFFKRLLVVAIVLISFFYFKYIGKHFSLVSIGLTSFAAVSQFAPAILLGMFWEKVNEKGAIAGIISGFLIWFFTLIVPDMINSGLLSEKIMFDGLFGLPFLKPYALFGLDTLDIWSHSMFWSMFFNIAIMVIVSLLTKQTELEIETSLIFKREFYLRELMSVKKKTIVNLSYDDIFALLSKFVGERLADEKLTKHLEEKGKSVAELNLSDLAELRDFSEKVISEIVGPGASKLIVESYLDMLGKGEDKVIDIFKDLVSYSVGESKDTLVKRVSELNVLLEISKIFSGPGSLNQKIIKSLNLLKKTFKFDLVVLRVLEGDVLKMTAYAGQLSQNLDLDRKLEELESSFLGKSIKEKKPIAVNDINLIPINENVLEIKEAGYLSFCHLPLIIENEVKGVISFFSKIYKGMYTNEFITLLESVAHQIAFSIKSHEQTREIIKMREIAKELEIARSIQRSLLPDKPPAINYIDFAGVCYAYEFVGGDYYDYFEIGDDVLDVVIADVSGHNVASALLMSEVRTLIKSIIATNPNLQPKDIIKKLNYEIYDDLEKLEFIITLVYLRLDFKRNKIIYTNAGHPKPLVCKQGEIKELEGGDPLLGVIKEYEFEQFEYSFSKDEFLFVYTDGIVEAENIFGDFFGLERLFATIKNNCGGSSEEVIAYIYEELLKFIGDNKQKDDVTMVGIKFKK
ncbi:serine phosphatase [Deferribacter desulfuricans SSM1]|uniref:Serine phosphatase n=1 Tax=Deferribacter desulfuricans (strain DSM 14783 / JCM 11476 / NBRC 101012 / SSM1) TaxID=639282 RepID=D3P8T5_DEFDS|nr:SpoIIE family protein phosphatase [Deferribacter desulfuricans]BAI81125.1 serine phosphatase [Deferribacter desulfuricans SSM1]